MTPADYGREALRRLRQQQMQATRKPESQASLLEQIPPDAAMDDATITVWNGERWAAYNSWLATAPITCEESPPRKESGITLAPAMKAQIPRSEERQIELPMTPEAANG
jgi:hypothetical protein